MTKHTATPWRLLRNYDNKPSEEIENRHTIKDDNGWNIARIWEPTGSHYTQAQQEANADFIVTACNSHDELLNALQKIEMLMTKADRDQLEDWADFGARVYLLNHEVRAAIANAKGV